MIHLLHLVDQLRRADRRRPSMPGEHFATLTAAVGILRWASRTRSPMLRTAIFIAGGAMVLRGLSGRDGPIAALKRR